MLGALVAQYMVSDHAPEVIMIKEQVNADGLVVKIEEQKLADLTTVPVEQHQPMLQAIAKEFNDLIAIGTFTGYRGAYQSQGDFISYRIEGEAPG